MHQREDNRCHRKLKIIEFYFNRKHSCFQDLSEIVSLKQTQYITLKHKHNKLLHRFFIQAQLKQSIICKRVYFTINNDWPDSIWLYLDSHKDINSIMESSAQSSRNVGLSSVMNF